MNNTNPTMNDVARVAGVALKTVSRYVNGETNINEDLAERIAAAIKKLGYRRNLAAASIRPGWTSKIIGVVTSDLANPYYAALTRAIERYAREHDYLTISASCEEDGAIFDRIVDRLMEQRVDGLIAVPPLQEGRSWESVAPPTPPLVLLDRPASAPEGSADTILVDNHGGAELATRTLLEQGARRIAFVGDSLKLHTMRERRAGYVSALAQAGIDPDPLLTRDRAHTSEDAASVVEELLRTANPDAIFAANNRSAIGTLFAFREADRRTPLIAFDDFEAARLLTPGVSVVAPDLDEMGRLAAEMVIDRAQHAGKPSVVRSLPARLILRGSERAPNRP